MARLPFMPRLEGSLILTYRCNAKCNMCDVWRNPTKAKEEIGLDVYRKLPALDFANITGGEPFIRPDIEDILEIVDAKAKRIVISTNGWFHDKMLAVARRFPRTGFRISLEGLGEMNDTIRGLPKGFDKAMVTLRALREVGITDLGFAMTVQGDNAKDLVPMYHLAKELNMEFATATLHNSHYFFKNDNAIPQAQKADAIEALSALIDEMLQSSNPKEWFRAYFNSGLINYIEGGKRPLPCRMGHHAFFLDPWGYVLPCNGMEKAMPMGNLVEQSWDSIWNSAKAEEVRAAVRACERECWMIGSASPAMKKAIHRPAAWILKEKLFRRRATSKRPLS